MHLNYRMFEIIGEDPVTKKPVSIWWYGGTLFLVQWWCVCVWLNLATFAEGLIASSRDLLCLVWHIGRAEHPCCYRWCRFDAVLPFPRGCDPVPPTAEGSTAPLSGY